MSLETRVEALEQDIQEIKVDLETHSKMLMGDMEKRQEGLYFVVADIGKLVASHTELLSITKKDFDNRMSEHVVTGHYNRQSVNMWKRLGFNVLDHVGSALILGLILLALDLFFIDISVHCTGFACK